MFDLIYIECYNKFVIKNKINFGGKDMNNKKIREALKMIGEGFNLLADSLDTVQFESEPVEVKVERPTTKEVEAPVKKVEEESNTVTFEELDALTYNDIKTKAKEFGVKAVGSKATIIENILATLGTSEPTQKPVAEPVKPTKVEEPVEDVEEVDEVEEEEDEAESLYDQVVRELSDYDDEELADILSDVGISPKGKRQALLSKIVQAIEEGKLEWGDEEDNVEMVDSDDTQDLYEFKGSDTRRAVCEKINEQLEQDIEDGELTHKQVLKFLQKYYNGTWESVDQDSDFDEYISIQIDLVDDEGEVHPLKEAYYIADDVYCCASQLKDVDGGELFCAFCGQTYTIE